MQLKKLIKTPRIYKKKDKDLYIDILKWAAKQETFTIKRLIKDLDITSIYLKSWINKEIERESLFINEINRCRLLANNEFESIAIEFKPIELMEK